MIIHHATMFDARLRWGYNEEIEFAFHTYTWLFVEECRYQENISLRLLRLIDLLYVLGLWQRCCLHRVLDPDWAVALRTKLFIPSRIAPITRDFAYSFRYCPFVTSSTICMLIWWALLPLTGAICLIIGSTDRNKEPKVPIPWLFCIRAP